MINVPHPTQRRCLVEPRCGLQFYVAWNVQVGRGLLGGADGLHEAPRSPRPPNESEHDGIAIRRWGRAVVDSRGQWYCAEVAERIQVNRLDCRRVYEGHIGLSEFDRRRHYAGRQDIHAWVGDVGIQLAADVVGGNRWPH